MEVEARRVGLDCLRSRECALFELQLDDDFGWDDGLICGGRVNIFINPRPEESAESYRAAIVATESRTASALCTVIKGDASRLGTTFFFRNGNGKGEGPSQMAAVLAQAADSALDSGRAGTVELDSGEHLYVEPILPRPTLLIAGAGHVGGALAQIGSMCGFQVVIVDDRPSFANKERLPFADRVEVTEIAPFIRDFPIDRETYVVIVTRGHRNDAQCLRECIHSNANYIGMIGSKRKICVIYEELLREGLATPEELRRVHSPLGLDIGAKEVGEIAVSIAAELIAIRRGVPTSAIPAMQYAPPFLRETADG
jgi:xanthine dehydrogenase accessory factor